MFQNRAEAGRRLAEKLEPFQGQNAVVLALPRGGVAVGYEIAQKLGLPLDIVVTRKIGHPQNLEYAVGAVDESGLTIFNEREEASVERQWLAEEILKQKKESARRSDLYRQGGKSLEIGGKVVIITDDGIATGLTMRLAVRVVKRQQPAKVVVAVPVASAESVSALRSEGADEVVLLEKPEEFVGAVGAHYQEFEQVSDEEVIRFLHP